MNSNCIFMPKVLWSWNLHQQLPRDLHFFIMFSSIAGVLGPVGQSNYASGNTFMDVLSRYRLSLGEKAISLNFSMMAASDGWSLENERLLKIFLQGSNIVEMSQTEILAVMDHYCNKNNPSASDRAQLILGLEVPADVVRRGTGLSGWMTEPTFLNLHQVTADGSGEEPGHCKTVSKIWAKMSRRLGLSTKRQRFSQRRLQKGFAKFSP